MSSSSYRFHHTYKRMAESGMYQYTSSPGQIMDSCVKKTHRLEVYDLGPDMRCTGPIPVVN